MVALLAIVSVTTDAKGCARSGNYTAGEGHRPSELVPMGLSPARARQCPLATCTLASTGRLGDENILETVDIG